MFFINYERYSIILMTNPDLLNQNTLSECGYLISLGQKMPVKVSKLTNPIF